MNRNEVVIKYFNNTKGEISFLTLNHDEFVKLCDRGINTWDRASVDMQIACKILHDNAETECTVKLEPPMPLEIPKPRRYLFNIQAVMFWLLASIFASCLYGLMELTLRYSGNTAVEFLCQCIGFPLLATISIFLFTKIAEEESN